MADITILTGIESNNRNQTMQMGTVWTSPTVGYVFVIDNTLLVYSKTHRRV